MYNTLSKIDLKISSNDINNGNTKRREKILPLVDQVNNTSKSPIALSPIKIKKSLLNEIKSDLFSDSTSNAEKSIDISVKDLIIESVDNDIIANQPSYSQIGKKFEEYTKHLKLPSLNEIKEIVYKTTKQTQAPKTKASTRLRVTSSTSSLNVYAKYLTISNWIYNPMNIHESNLYIHIIQTIILREGYLLKLTQICESLDMKYWQYACLRIELGPTNTLYLTNKQNITNKSILLIKKKQLDILLNQIKELQLEISIVIAYFRSTTILVINLIFNWRDYCIQSHGTKEILSIYWNNENYLIKMKNDYYSLINSFTTLNMWLGFDLANNPFLLPEQLDVLNPIDRYEYLIEVFKDWLNRKKDKILTSNAIKKSGVLADNESNSVDINTNSGRSSPVDSRRERYKEVSLDNEDINKVMSRSSDSNEDTNIDSNVDSYVESKPDNKIDTSLFKLPTTYNDKTKLESIDWIELRDLCKNAWAMNTQSIDNDIYYNTKKCIFGNEIDNFPWLWSNVEIDFMIMLSSIGFREVYPSIYLVPPVTNELREKCDRCLDLINEEINNINIYKNKIGSYITHNNKTAGTNIINNKSNVEIITHETILQYQLLKLRQTTISNDFFQLTSMNNQIDSHSDVTSRSPLHSSMSRYSTNSNLSNFSKFSNNRTNNYQIKLYAVNKVKNDRMITEKTDSGQIKLRDEIYSKRHSKSLYHQNMYIRKIQIQWKYYKLRKLIKHKRHLKRINDSLILIQKYMRGFISRLHVKNIRRNLRIDTLILRKDVLKRFKAAIVITDFMRDSIIKIINKKYGNISLGIVKHKHHNIRKNSVVDDNDLYIGRRTLMSLYPNSSLNTNRKESIHQSLLTSNNIKNLLNSQSMDSESTDTIKSYHTIKSRESSIDVTSNSNDSIKYSEDSKSSNIRSSLSDSTIDNIANQLYNTIANKPINKPSHEIKYISTKESRFHCRLIPKRKDRGVIYRHFGVTNEREFVGDSDRYGPLKTIVNCDDIYIPPIFGVINNTSKVVRHKRHQSNEIVHDNIKSVLKSYL